LTVVGRRLDSNSDSSFERLGGSLMGKGEAQQLLKARVNQLRAMSYHDLLGLMDKETVTEVDGSPGRRYSIETQVFWDGAKDRDLRVMVSIDDGGWRAYAPLTDDFIMAPDGSFVGE
jgi:hypothetical protein